MEIKVSLVTIGSVKATVANSGNYPVSMTGNATCERTTTTTTTNTDPTTPNGDKFIQISAFLFMLILTVF